MLSAYAARLSPVITLSSHFMVRLIFRLACYTRAAFRLQFGLFHAAMGGR